MFTVSAQTAAPATTSVPVPTTKLESFLSQTGVLSVRESILTVTNPTLYGAKLSVEAVRLYSPGQESVATKGMLFSLTSGEKYASAKTDFLDSDEISGLIKALDYIQAQSSKIDKALTPEFRYTTKSGLRVGEFVQDNGDIFGFVKSGSTTVYMAAQNVVSLRDGLNKLQTALDSSGK